MILYEIDNIRDLFGHKVQDLTLVYTTASLESNGLIVLLSFVTQVDLGLIKRNPICRIGIE